MPRLPETSCEFSLNRLCVKAAERLAGRRAVLHGVGEPMLVRALPRMIRYLKARGVYVLFNTNGTILTRRHAEALTATGLDELRVSLDAADAATFKKVRGRDYFDRIVNNLRGFVAYQAETGNALPRLSLWLTGLKDTIETLPQFVALAADIGIPTVYLQRLVFDDTGRGLARPDKALFDHKREIDEAAITAATALATQLGVRLDASGAVEPSLSLQRGEASSPRSLCRRPWSLMYFTANGRALPCCIAPFSARGYANYTLGDAKTQTLAEIFNGPAYQTFRAALLGDAPPAPCRNCGLRWSL
ncbi:MULTISPECIES: radical SAM/SPASM domain-containing protein [Acidiphilium]|uniref:radical SAM/SPASM domain-containing protein n=1 Tax=Acidiphilium TaxID=522 RepID=UPI00257DC81A|nr:MULTISPECIES: radical SAM/SPASM domain-containing protein [Acidiphilium]HQT86869.1 radical SAM/SPASM domain-containing protein [Acidiphilium rubrum]